jgi:hypothetical protein
VTASETSPIAVRKARNQAARMSQTGQAQQRGRAGAICDIDRRRIDPGAATGDLTSAAIAGSMDDHANDDGEVFAL